MYVDRGDSWGYYDSNVESDLHLFVIKDNIFTSQPATTLTDYNFTNKDWWYVDSFRVRFYSQILFIRKLGLTGWNGAWTPIYMSANANDGRVIAYTLRAEASVPAVVQITYTVVYLQDFFIDFNLTANGLAFLAEDHSLEIIAGTRGVPVSVAGDVFAKNCSVSMITAVTETWLNTSGFLESHFTMTFDEMGLTYVDIVSIRTKGNLVLWMFLITPEKDFLDTVREQQQVAISHSRISLWIVLFLEFCIGAVAVTISVALSLVLARSLGEIISKLQRVSRGQIAKTDSNTNLRNSMLQEIDSLNWEVARMQSALESFSQYVPNQVVRYLCKNNMKPVVGVSTMHCTVMFLDVVDFTRNMDQHGAQTIIDILSIMFESFSTIITKNQGCIDKYIGDAIMALWGCPVIDHNSEFHACKAVAEILDSLSKLNMIFAAKSYPTMRVRIGLHSGEVKAGNVGSSHRLNYTVLGNTVNLASRLEPLSKELGTSVLVSSSIRDAAKSSGAFSWRALGHTKVRGFKDPVLVHEFFGLTSHLTPEHKKLLSDYEHIDNFLYNNPIQLSPESLTDNSEEISQAMASYLEVNPSDYPITQARIKLFNSPQSPPTTST
ncbi:adenylate cyclase [Pelomyxa schiedti]|nr:adenylate cyclase [Pelomyxa schiedti]